MMEKPSLSTDDEYDDEFKDEEFDSGSVSTLDYKTESIDNASKNSSTNNEKENFLDSITSETKTINSEEDDIEASVWNIKDEVDDENNRNTRKSSESKENANDEAGKKDDEMEKYIAKRMKELDMERQNQQGVQKLKKKSHGKKRDEFDDVPQHVLKHKLEWFEKESLYHDAHKAHKRLQYLLEKNHDEKLSKETDRLEDSLKLLAKQEEDAIRLVKQKWDSYIRLKKHKLEMEEANVRMSVQENKIFAAQNMHREIHALSERPKFSPKMLHLQEEEFRFVQAQMYKEANQVRREMDIKARAERQRMCVDAANSVTLKSQLFTGKQQERLSRASDKTATDMKRVFVRRNRELENLRLRFQFARHRIQHEMALMKGLPKNQTHVLLKATFASPANKRNKKLRKSLKSSKSFTSRSNQQKLKNAPDMTMLISRRRSTAHIENVGLTAPLISSQKQDKDKISKYSSKESEIVRARSRSIAAIGNIASLISQLQTQVSNSENHFKQERRKSIVAAGVRRRSIAAARASLSGDEVDNNIQLLQPLPVGESNRPMTSPDTGICSGLLDAEESESQMTRPKTAQGRTRQTKSRRKTPNKKGYFKRKPIKKVRGIVHCDECERECTKGETVSIPNDYDYQPHTKRSAGKFCSWRCTRNWNSKNSPTQLKWVRELYIDHAATISPKR